MILFRYYTALRAKIVSGVVYAFVLFASTFRMHLLYVILFPTYIDESVAVELDTEEKYILLTDTFNILQ